MEDKIRISMLEKIVINACSPLLHFYSLHAGEESSFMQIVVEKEEVYRRLLGYLKKDGEIPPYVRDLYSGFPCGIIALKTASIRKFFL